MTEIETPPQDFCVYDKEVGEYIHAEPGRPILLHPSGNLLELDLTNGHWQLNWLDSSRYICMLATNFLDAERKPIYIGHVFWPGPDFNDIDPDDPIGSACSDLLVCEWDTETAGVVFRSYPACVNDCVLGAEEIGLTSEGYIVGNAWYDWEMIVDGVKGVLV